MSEEKQIRNMIAFIEAEAREKATEIEQQAQEEYDIERQQLVEKGKQAAFKEVEERKKQLDIERRVTHANNMKEQNMRVLRERERQIELLKESVKQQCIALTQNTSEYRSLLTGLIVQALCYIRADAEVQCRAADVAHVEAVMKEAEGRYNKKHAGNVSVKLCTTTSLSDDVWGGIVVTGHGGKIMCDSTFKQRASVCFEEQLPTVRHALFN